MKKILLLLTLFFINQCIAQIIDYQDFNFGLLGWEEVHTIGTSTLYGWGTIASINDYVAPYEGSRCARFGSFFVPAGNVYELRSPAFTFAGNSYKIKFEMYRENSNPTQADNIQVYYNTIPGSNGGILLGTVNRVRTLSPVVPSDDWYSYDFDLPAGVTGTGYLTLVSTSAKGNGIFLDNLSVEQVPQNDVQNNRLAIDNFILSGTTPIKGTIKNLGLQPIISMDINWQVDTGAIHTQTVSGVNILPNQTYAFTHSDVWNAPSGSYLLKTWISNVNNGGVDDNIANDRITKTVEVVDEIFPKTAVYEVSTGSWCGWCIRTHIALKDMEHYHHDSSFIGIAVHNYNNYDPMQVNAYNSGMSAYNGGTYPNGTTNRTQLQLDPAYVELGYNALSNKPALGKVSIPTQSWNPTTRQLTFDAHAFFARNITSANYKLAAVIVEDGVTGTENGYSQSNYYSQQGIDITDWEGINWRNLGNPIPAAAMVYNRVARALPGGFTGVAGSIPTTVNYNVPYTHSFNYTVPATQNPNNLKLIALLVDSTTGQITNAAEVPLNTTLSTSAFDAEKFIIYPNPTNGILHFITNQTVNITIMDMLGEIVFSGKNIVSGSSVDISSLQKGIYLIKLAGESFVKTEKLILK